MPALVEPLPSKSSFDEKYIPAVVVPIVIVLAIVIVICVMIHRSKKQRSTQ